MKFDFLSFSLVTEPLEANLGSSASNHSRRQNLEEISARVVDTGQLMNESSYHYCTDQGVIAAGTSTHLHGLGVG